jgi:IclR family KDG regulon transcriptional repressor
MDRTLSKGLRLIELLAAAKGSLGVSELAKSAGLTKSNTHRLLQTLTASGWVTRTPHSSNYQLSLKVWSIANSVVDHLGIREIARSKVLALNVESEETVHLAVLDQLSVVLIDRIETPRAVRAVLPQDGRAPIYCVETGKALLAFQDAALINEVCANLRPYTPTTITDPKRLKAELLEIRARGYAANEGEWHQGVFGIAVPIFGPDGAAIASIGLVGPAERFAPTSVRRLLPLVRAASERISADLGYTLMTGEEVTRRKTGGV